MGGKEKVRIFLVDDDPLFSKSLENVFFGKDEFEIISFHSSKDCLANLGKKPDIVVLDYNLDGIDKTSPNGLTTLKKIKEQAPETRVIMLSSQDRIEVVVNCMKNEASDYIVKNETAFVRLKIAIKNIFSHPSSPKTIERWDW